MKTYFGMCVPFLFNAVVKRWGVGPMIPTYREEVEVQRCPVPRPSSQS